MESSSRGEDKDVIFGRILPVLALLLAIGIILWANRAQIGQLVAALI